MSLVVSHNLMAANTARNLNTHYGRLATSTQRLSSGLRINGAADDAAGLAIRELMRADVAALHQGVRNANDAISLIQTADGALSIIDEKLIRMKELAEQAATGTYNSTQRLMIDSEFKAMASEIDRIANATDFNGLKLLDGSLNGKHEGSGMNPAGAMKIHFGTANDSAEDYYYIDIPPATVEGLGLVDYKHSELVETLPITYPPTALLDPFTTVNAIFNTSFSAIDPATGNFDIKINMETTIEDGKVIKMRAFDEAGFELDASDIYVRADTLNVRYLNQQGIITGPIRNLVGGGAHVVNQYSNATDYIVISTNFHITNSLNPHFSINLGINHFGDSDGKILDLNIDGNTVSYRTDQDALLHTFNFNRTWYDDRSIGNVMSNMTYNKHIDSEKAIYSDIKTQEEAQNMLVRLEDAIVQKDKIRAHLGAIQNRLENTVSNLTIQAENLQASESRISDVDVATEMTNFVRNQILTQSAVAMLSQANTLPQMAMQLIGG